MPQFRYLLFGLLFVLATSDTASSQTTTKTINDKVVNFMAANVDQRIGGGGCADAVSEAIRISGGAFTERDLGSDYPSAGDRMWGTPVKVLSYQKSAFTDSNPSAEVLPGDILQYSGAKFVYVTDSGRKTTTKTITMNHHTTVAANVDSKTKLPVKVYEQNAASTANVNTRVISLNPVDFSRLRDGMVVIYRPRARIDAPAKFQFSVVNNTNSTKLPVLKSRLNTVTRLSLNPSNTDSSYMATWATSMSSEIGLSLVLPNGESIPVSNAAGYEIYQRTSGLYGVRKVAP